jgi:hypothetical protein
MASLIKRTVKQNIKPKEIKTPSKKTTKTSNNQAILSMITHHQLSSIKLRIPGIEVTSKKDLKNTDPVAKELTLNYTLNRIKLKSIQLANSNMENKISCKE